MDETNYLRIIEQLNKEKQEIRNSKEFKLGFRIIETLDQTKKGNIRKLLKNYKDKNATKKLRCEPEYKSNEVEYEYIDKESRIAVYTCVIGQYDSIAAPLLTFPNVDFVLFTDKPKLYEKYSDVYRIVEIPESILKKGPVLANRYIKLHPKPLLDLYDYAIYIDGNIRVISDIRKFICKASVPIGIAMHRHRERSCIYEEAYACELYKRGHIENLRSQIERYRAESFPAQFGMNEATIIVSDLKNENANILLDKWWNEFDKTQSLRDQIAWPYVLWKNGFTINDVGNLGSNIYQNYVIEILKHQ